MKIRNTSIACICSLVSVVQAGEIEQTWKSMAANYEPPTWFQVSSDVDSSGANATGGAITWA